MSSCFLCCASVIRLYYFVQYTEYLLHVCAGRGIPILLLILHISSVKFYELLPYLIKRSKKMFCCCTDCKIALWQICDLWYWANPNKNDLTVSLMCGSSCRQRSEVPCLHSQCTVHPSCVPQSAHTQVLLSARQLRDHRLLTGGHHSEWSFLGYITFVHVQRETQDRCWINVYIY